MIIYIAIHEEISQFTHNLVCQAVEIKLPIHKVCVWHPAKIIKKYGRRRLKNRNREKIYSC